MRRLLISIALFFLCEAAFGQEIGGTISGTITDPSGASIPNVTVTVRNLGTDEARKTTTGPDGSYLVPSLISGNYEVRVEGTGFQTEIRTGISLAVAQHAVIDVQLVVGNQTQTVEVTAGAPLIEASSSALSGLVDDTQMRALPLNGRDFFSLTYLQPGVVPTLNAGPNPWGQGGITKAAVNGLRPTYNNVTIDGTDVNDPTYNIPPGGASGDFLGVESIREFRVLTNTMSAEYGRNAGAAINAITQSGTNKFHGSVYEFVRNSALDAKNYFDLADRSIPYFSQNQFGGTIGGPIQKDRTFFFGNYEGFRQQLSKTNVATVPDENAHNGILPDPNNPGQTINVGVNPAIAPYLALYQLPNGPNFGDGTAELITSLTQPTTENYGVIRVDHKFSEKDSVFGRYIIDFSDLSNPYLSTLTPGFPAKQDRHNQFLTLSETHLFGGTWLNEFRFGFNRTQYAASANNSNPGLSISVLDPTGPLGLIQVGQLSAIGNSVLFPINSAGNTFQFLDAVSVNKGHHFVKFGADIRRVQMNGIFDLYSGGNYTFNTLQDFLENQPFSYFGALPGSNSNRGYRQSLFAFYVQDDYKILPQLTMNFGLRYEYNTSPTEAHNLNVNIRHPLTDTNVTLGDPLYHAPKNMFGPRIGLAWTPFRDGKTVVRAGFGIFYDQLWMNLYGNTRWSPPHYHTTFFLSPEFPDPLAMNGGAIPVGINSPIQFNPSQPYAMQYNLNIQRELTSSMALTIAYVGTRGVHLPSQQAVNPPTPIVEPDGSLFFPANAPRLNRNFGPVSDILMAANSFYNAFQATLNKRLSQGLDFQISYTFSKSIDDVSGPYPTDWTTDPAIPQNPFDLQASRARSSFDHTHVLVANFNYQLPFGHGQRYGADSAAVVNGILGGWAISGITTAETGNPFTVLLGFDQCQTIDPPCYPNVDKPLLRVTGHANQWYDPAAFSLQPVGTLGDSPRNVLLGPNLFTLDFALRKTFRLSDRFNLEFRSEFFNITNRPNFASPNNTRDPTGSGGKGDVVINDPSGLPVGNAGQIFSTVTTSRQIQFALKLMF